jgi:hypothetical protein
MAGFKKAKSEQAALKISCYGPPGSGKTFSALLIAEGLASTMQKRIAFVDTELGTSFYCQDVPERKAHPTAFDFDALYTKSLTEILASVKQLSFAEHGVIVIDSITHVWEAAKAAFSGKTNNIGQIPMWAWGLIKKPYKELINFLINSPFHVLILGRQGTEFAEDENTGESKALGVKMKAEGETAYEPHICIRMESVRTRKNQLAVPTAFVEKDRTGILQGKTIPFPTFDSVARPLLGLLGSTQAKVQAEEDAAQQDADALAAQERARAAESADRRREFNAGFQLARTVAEVEAIGKQITPDFKKRMLTEDVGALRDAYHAAITRVKANPPAPPSANGKAKRNGRQAEIIAKLEWKKLLAVCADSGCDPVKLAAFYQLDSLAQLPHGQLALAMTLATKPTPELMIDFEVQPSIHG